MKNIKNLTLVALTLVTLCMSAQASAASSKNKKKKQTTSQTAPVTPTYQKAWTEEEPRLGAGVFIGIPTGATGKFWLNKTYAVDATLAYSFGGWLMGYADYLYNFRHLFRGDYGSATRFVTHLNPYFGAGILAFISAGTYTKDRSFYSDRDTSGGFGVRAPVGVEWMPGKPPLGVYVELAPGFGLVPSAFFIFQGGFGARYYFM